MALSDEENATITRLALRHDAEIPELEALDQWYEGNQSVQYMHPEIFADAADRIRPVIIHWPQLAVDAIAERLVLQGIESGDDDLDKEFLRVWCANGMDMGLPMALTDALVMRRSYISVGTNADDPKTPIVAPESPLELYVDMNPSTRKGRAALRRTSDVDPVGSVSARYATLYLPNVTIWCDWSGGWRELDRDEHKLGELPIASLVNRPRTRSSVKTPRNLSVQRIGRSEMDAIIPIADAANKLATDMMVAAEYVAIPLRAIFGAGPADFLDQDGNPMTLLQVIQGRLMAIPESDVKAFEFAAAQLQNFTGALEAMSKIGGSVTGLPPHYMGTPSDNPASAEAIASSESRLTTRSERAQTPFDIGIRNVARLQHRFATGSWDEALDTAKPDWRDVRTPTVAAKADAAVKLYTTTPAIVPLKQTRQALGYSDSEIDAMEDEDEKAAERSPMAAIARGVSGASGANEYAA